jgi:hypothetical protein
MTVAGSLFDNARPEPNAFDARLRATDGLFTSGSPTSSALAATFVPSIFTKTSHVPGTDLPLAVNKSAIPYHFHGGTAADLIVKSASQEGAERAVFNNGLVVNGEIWHPPQLSERGGRLKTDFLLLTVLPWSQGGGYAVIVSGGHGPGTGAFQLLMDPDFFSLRSLEKLIEDLGVARAYQVVFEVSVTHAGKYSAPNAIRVSSECPPQKIQTDSLFSSENDTLTNTVRAAIATNEVM